MSLLFSGPIPVREIPGKLTFFPCAFSFLKSPTRASHLSLILCFSSPFTTLHQVSSQYQTYCYATSLVPSPPSTIFCFLFHFRYFVIWVRFFFVFLSFRNYVKLANILGRTFHPFILNFLVQFPIICFPNRNIYLPFFCVTSISIKTLAYTQFAHCPFICHDRSAYNTSYFT